MDSEKLKDSHKQVENIQSLFDEHVIYTMTDLNGIITAASEAFCHETGYEESDVLGRTHSFLRAPDFPDSVYDQLWATITDNKTWEGEIKNVKKNGELYWTNNVIQSIFDHNHEKMGYLSIRQDITKEKMCEKLSLVDELTGIYNRRKLNMELNHQLINFYRYHDNFSLVMMDIDFFKKFNDDHGHLIGDEILKELCYTLRHNIRQGDIFARWGGEEFMLLLNKADKCLAEKICQKLIEKIRIEVPNYLKRHFDINEKVTCSFGLTTATKADSVDSLLGRVDRALYLAKSNGRNRIESL